MVSKRKQQSPSSKFEDYKQARLSRASRDRKRSGSDSDASSADMDDDDHRAHNGTDSSREVGQKRAQAAQAVATLREMSKRMNMRKTDDESVTSSSTSRRRNPPRRSAAEASNIVTEYISNDMEDAKPTIALQPALCCPFCPKTFNKKNRYNFYRHLSDKHTDIRVYACSGCCQGFLSLNIYLNHLVVCQKQSKSIKDKYRFFKQQMDRRKSDEEAWMSTQIFANKIVDFAQSLSYDEPVVFPVMHALWCTCCGHSTPILNTTSFMDSMRTCCPNGEHAQLRKVSVFSTDEKFTRPAVHVTYLSHSRSIPTCCVMCSFETTEPDLLLRHLDTAHVGPFGCKACSRSFADAIGYHDHALNGCVTGVCQWKDFLASVPSEATMDRVVLKDSMDCALCGYEFAVKDFNSHDCAASHTRRLLVDDRIVKCPAVTLSPCVINIPQNPDLPSPLTESVLRYFEATIRIPADIGQFQDNLLCDCPPVGVCRICRMRFADQVELENHQVICDPDSLSDDKTVRCELCQSVFDSPSLLDEHVVYCKQKQAYREKVKAKKSSSPSPRESAEPSPQVEPTIWHFTSPPLPNLPANDSYLCRVLHPSEIPSNVCSTFACILIPGLKEGDTMTEDSGPAYFVYGDDAKALLQQHHINQTAELSSPTKPPSTTASTPLQPRQETATTDPEIVDLTDNHADPAESTTTYQFDCPICSMLSLPTQFELQRHIKRNHIYVCRNCLVCFSTAPSYELHQQTCNSVIAKMISKREDELGCPLCTVSFKFSDVRSYYGHLIDEHTASVYHNTELCTITPIFKRIAAAAYKKPLPTSSSILVPNNSLPSNSNATEQRALRTSLLDQELGELIGAIRRDPKLSSIIDDVVTDVHQYVQDVHLNTPQIGAEMEPTFDVDLVIDSVASRAPPSTSNVQTVEQQPASPLNCVCEVCPVESRPVFSNEKEFFVHIYSHTLHNQAYCNVCETSFASSDHLKRHISFHSSDSNRPKLHAVVTNGKAFLQLSHRRRPSSPPSPQQVEVGPPAEPAVISLYSADVNLLPATSGVQREATARTDTDDAVVLSSPTKADLVEVPIDNQSPVTYSIDDDDEIMLVEDETAPSSSKPREAMFACSTCPSRFLTRLAMKEHALSHANDAGATTTDVLPVPSDMPLWVCRVCSVAYENLTVYEGHVRKHNVAIYCLHCSCLSFSREQLLEHQKAHAAIVFGCSLCFKATKSDTQLCNHLQVVHGMDLTWICKECGFAHSRNATVFAHIQSKHANVIAQNARPSADRHAVETLVHQLMAVCPSRKLHFQPQPNSKVEVDPAQPVGECTHRGFNAYSETTIACAKCGTLVPASRFLLEDARLRDTGQIKLSLVDDNVLMEQASTPTPPPPPPPPQLQRQPPTRAAPVHVPANPPKLRPTFAVRHPPPPLAPSTSRGRGNAVNDNMKSITVRAARALAQQEQARAAIAQQQKEVQVLPQQQMQVEQMTGPTGCNICGMTCSSQAALKVHNLKHNRQVTEFCLSCGETAKDSEALLAHVNIHRANITWNLVCPVRGCAAAYNAIDKLRLHLRQHKTLNHCPICALPIAVVNMQGHLNDHSQHGKFACLLCARCFATQEHLHIHEPSHGFESWRICRECGLCFRNPPAFNEHFISNHVISSGTGEEIYCGACGGNPLIANVEIHGRCAHSVTAAKLRQQACLDDAFNAYFITELAHRQAVTPTRAGRMAQNVSPIQAAQQVCTIYVCQTCNESSTGSSTLRFRRHYAHKSTTHDSTMPAYWLVRSDGTCNLCSHKIPKNDISAHLRRYHVSSGFYPCSICERAHYNAADARYHLAISHRIPAAEQAVTKLHQDALSATSYCFLCVQTFDSDEATQEHIWQEHFASSSSRWGNPSGKQIIVCIFCGMSFPASEIELIQRHIVQHCVDAKVEKPYPTIPKVTSSIVPVSSNSLRSLSCARCYAQLHSRQVLSHFFQCSSSTADSTLLVNTHRHHHTVKCRICWAIDRND